MYENLEIIKKFDENSLPSLSTVTLAALELFIKEGLPKVELKNFKKPVVIGSGNAIATAKVIFANTDAVFADENTYQLALQREGVDGVVIFSASGAKHAPIIAKKALEKNLQVQLITCTNNSPAQEIIGKQNTIITKKNREPYTYNTSTYMGWILAKTKEDPKKIYDFIKNKIENKIEKIPFDKYNGFLLVTPNHLSSVNHLFEVKFIELFARLIARDVKTFEELKHAITVVPSKTELCIKFGKEKVEFANDILEIELPQKIGPATLMAMGYFIIGKIQEKHKQYFKENIKTYIDTINKNSFGKGMNVIVE